MTLTMATAAYRFAALPAPGIGGEPQGSQVARAVAIPGIGTLPDPLRRLILAAVNIAVSIIYRGKDFHHHHGVNVWALGIRWAQFDITHDGRQTFLSTTFRRTLARCAASSARSARRRRNASCAA